MTDTAVHRPRRPGCLRALVAVVLAVVLGGVALRAHLTVGVAAAGERAQRDLDTIGRALDSVRLFPRSEPADPAPVLGEADRLPRDRAEAEEAVRASRLGDGMAFLVYCGDQCPSWQPSDARSEHRYRELRWHSNAGRTCEVQANALEATGSTIGPIATGSASGTVCSFGGCVGRVAVRLDLRADDGLVYAFDLLGAIGDASSFVDQLPECGP